MPFDWLTGAMERLADAEPMEVMQVLSGERRRRPVVTQANGMRLLSIWGRTRAGRGLIVVLRHDQNTDYLIAAARGMTAAEDAVHTAWEKEGQ